MLARTAELLGNAALIDKITQAQNTELEHLAKLRGWLEAADQARSKVARRTRQSTTTSRTTRRYRNAEGRSRLSQQP